MSHTPGGRHSEVTFTGPQLYINIGVALTSAVSVVLGGRHVSVPRGSDGFTTSVLVEFGFRLFMLQQHSHSVFHGQVP